VELRVKKEKGNSTLTFSLNLTKLELNAIKNGGCVAGTVPIQGTRQMMMFYLNLLEDEDENR
jgi:hypothetical protein